MNKELEQMYEDEIVAPTAEQLQTITEFARKQVQLMLDISKHEEHVALLKKRLAQVQERDLPDALSAAGCKEFTLSSGYKVVIKSDITASVSEEKRPQVCQWLVETGHDDLLKTDVVLSYEKGKREDANKLAKLLAEQYDLNPVVNTTVNTASLKALIRELLAKGKEVPLEKLGAFQWKKAVIESPQ